LFGIPEGKRIFEKNRHRWGDNTGVYVRRIGWEGVDWIHLAKDTDLVNTLMNLRVTYEERGGDFLTL
jgi:hypothetical protein